MSRAQFTGRPGAKRADAWSPGLVYAKEDVGRIALYVYGPRWMTARAHGRSSGTAARRGGRLADEDGLADDGASCRGRRAAVRRV